MAVIVLVVDTVDGWKRDDNDQLCFVNNHCTRARARAYISGDRADAWNVEKCGEEESEKQI